MRGDNGRGGAGTRRIPTKSKREPAATFHGQGVDLCGVTTQGPRSGPSTVRHRKSTTLDTVTAASQGFHPPSLSICRPRISLLESHHLLCRYSEVEGSSLLPWACPATPTPPHPRLTPLGSERKDSYWGRTEGAPDLWKWTICHLPSLRCQTRVSSDWAVRGMPPASRYCVMRM